MTNPGPWTASGQPETKKSRTWWVVGGVVAAALAVFLAYLMGRGWTKRWSKKPPEPPPWLVVRRPFPRRRPPKQNVSPESVTRIRMFYPKTLRVSPE